MSKVGVLLAVLAALIGAGSAAAAASSPAERLALAPCRIAVESPEGPNRETGARCGTFQVPENRVTGQGRMLSLKVIVLPASAGPSRAPVYYLSGGPGQAATDSAPGIATAPYRDNHDIVLMDVRGTGEGTRLDCALGGSDDNLQGYLDPLLEEGMPFAQCRDQLTRTADLTQYSTVNAMRDLDELREALGHRRIVLEAGSYGTRAALIYIRMFGQHVHAAALFSLVAIENRAPLYHAAAAQRAIEETARQCAAEAACHAAFPDPLADLRAVMARLAAAPAQVTVRHPATGAPASLTLSAPAFADGLRVLLYSADRGRRVPLLLHRARAGDLVPFAEAALQNNRAFKDGIRVGLMFSFTCSEDVARIRPEEIAAATGDSFIGDRRVRGQMAACAVWPRTNVPAGFGEPVRSDVPVLLISGNLDPVTPPEWGERVARTLPNSRHIILPGGHTPFNDCVASLLRELYDRGSVEGLDTRCVAEVRNPPFALPEPEAAAN